MRTLSLLVLFTLATAADAVRLEVKPTVFMPGATVRLTCQVPPYSENRMVRFGFSNYQVSERQLDGLKSRITWESEFKHVPCDPGEAFCEVVRSDGRSVRVRRNVEVATCE